MSIKSYTLDSLRNLVRKLQKENKQLKERLGESCDLDSPSAIFEADYHLNPEYDEDQGSRVISRYVSNDMARDYFRVFFGRTDVFAKRGKKGGYFPQCSNRWNGRCPKYRGERQSCSDCSHKAWIPIDAKILIKHFLGYDEDGGDVIGIYPLLPDGTCRFLVFDFDDHIHGDRDEDYANADNKWQAEVDALRIMCENNGIHPLVERSRSGRGAHVWIIFSERINASLARKFGSLLLDIGANTVNMYSFSYYDRMYPSQDRSDGLGSLIALPMQGQALKSGNSAFVDDNWNAYPDQWKVVYEQVRPISLTEVNAYIDKWQRELLIDNIDGKSIEDRPKPWKRHDAFNAKDVDGKIHITYADGIYIDALNLATGIQNQIRALAAFDNPVYDTNKRLGYSNYDTLSSVYLGRDINGYIKIPRGLRDQLLKKCRDANIPYDITDERESGRPLRISFKGHLRVQQEVAAQSMLSYDDGILSAATGFGKTVVCSYLIGQKKLSTLILVPNKSLQDQWVDALSDFLEIDEPLPEYTTKGGKVKIRDSHIGVLNGNKNSLSGIIDVAMIGSVYGHGNETKLKHKYGMVIFDECHHAASETAVGILQNINAKYVYGVSATPMRSDKLDNVIYMLLGTIRQSFTAMDKAKSHGIVQYVYPRYTHVVDAFDTNNINDAYNLLSENSVRNEMIMRDVRECVAKGRTPLILTRQKSQAEYFYNKLLDEADNVILLYGDNTDKENSDNVKELKAVAKDKSLILIATGSKIGEGFDYPRLDTLMLTAPVSSSTILEQYLGRITREYNGKVTAIVYDYVDSHLPVFAGMYSKRLRTYKRIGFSTISNVTLEKQTANAIYSYDNYSDVFERDLIEANKSIVIASPEITKENVDRLLFIVKPRLESGCKISVITSDYGSKHYANIEYAQQLIQQIKEAGISVIYRDEFIEHFAIIDDEIVWHGSLNFLGQADIWDNLMRVKSRNIAVELLESVASDDD